MRYKDMLYKLEPLQRHDTKDENRGVIGLLLECHERIRHFALLAERLSTALEAPPDEVAAAATDLGRYFAIGLPKHEEDEEHSIAPRLLAVAFQSPAALEKMAAEHRQAHARLATLEPAWERLSKAPHELADLSAELSRTSSALRALFEQHLALEERAIFPAIDQLPLEEREAIVAEMHARRATHG